jgi:glycosyltransferase involved in cell wall biosynthesis
MGLSPLEAMSYGVPLVASVHQGGLQEIITSDEYGYLISSHDVDALATKIIFYLQNPHEARRIALNGRERVKSVSSALELTEKVESLLFDSNGK